MITKNELAEVLNKHNEIVEFAIKNFDIVDKFEYKRGNGMVICLTSEIVPLTKNDYLLPIEYI